MILSVKGRAGLRNIFYRRLPNTTAALNIFVKMPVQIRSHKKSMSHQHPKADPATEGSACPIE